MKRTAVISLLIISLWSVILLINISSGVSELVLHRPYGQIEQYIHRLPPQTKFSGVLSYKLGNSEKSDVVDNDTIAVRVALAILSSLYGDGVYDEMPYNVALVDDSVWVVETSLDPPRQRHAMQSSSDTDEAMLVFGGVGHVEINKHNGKIYSAYHTK